MSKPFNSIPLLSLLLFTVTLMGVIMAYANQYLEDYTALIRRGEFTKAQALIAEILREDADLTPVRRMELQFEVERMERIKKDFTKSETEVVAYIKDIIPEVTKNDLKRWEETRALESMIIDGEKHYFNRAARNLFRIDPDAKAQWQAIHPSQKMTSGSGAKLELDKHNQTIIDNAVKSGKRHVNPVRLRIKQSLDVDENCVPEGEIIRCWIPFPREIPERQTDIRIIATKPEHHIVSDNAQYLQRTVYFEKLAQADTKTHFEVTYEYTAHGMYLPVDPVQVKPVTLIPDLLSFVQEEEPHIIFTPALKKLSRRLVGDETNPYFIAQKLFEWVDTNIPWASAREYSTIRNISMYGYENRHGDCGIQTLLFITLCRLNGIPARWQSGWEFQPPDDSMHDWGMIYFEPYGWVPMDVTYGLRKSDDERLKWFYLSGMDSYRLIFNDAFYKPFYPAKNHPRSETVDSQRGEVEWRGGNLYFDRWDWGFEWEVID